VKPDARILVASDVVGDAQLVGKLLGDEFDNIVLCADAEQAVRDFDTHRPQVLVLAFHALEKAEQFYLGLYRHSSLIQGHPHRTLVLCNKDEVHRAYELCKRDYFDDYILFWPFTHDAPRLPMATHHALRELGHKGDAPSTAEFAVQARRVAELEAQLDQYIAKGRQQIDSASRSLERAEQDIGAALDSFSRKLPEPDSGVPAAEKYRAECRREIDHGMVEEIEKRLEAVGDAMHPVREWVGSIKEDLAPQLESARALGTLAKRVRPLVLVVDDDEFQHQLLTQILAELNLELIFALSSTEALATLRRHRPDLILMDVNLPDVDGIEVTRQIKSIEGLAGIPMLMITGRSEKNVVLDSLKAGASDFVVKPFDRDSLIGKMRKLLGGIAPR
jgi:CheY-like chemotaxis protein